MALYPSLEDMKVDQMMKAQLKDAVSKYYPGPGQQDPPAYSSIGPSAPPANAVPVYPSLNEFMGLDISPKTITTNVPEYSMAICPQQNQIARLPDFNNMIAPLSGQSVGLRRAHVSNGIRELILCKDKDGRVGIRVSSVSSGVFVCLVAKDSPASMAGVRFGDQILQINGTSVAGFTMDQVHKLFKKSDVNNISVIIRDRPFERTITLHKDSEGRVGFQFKKGEITTLVKDSSATRNGLLTHHILLEIDGQNVVGLKDKEITAVIDKAPSPMTVTVIPTYIYENIISKMSNSLMKNLMSHNVPDI